jgi:hypothetical protein
VILRNMVVLLECAPWRGLGLSYPSPISRIVQEPGSLE